ncbi:soluble pyridine nucleotide transhydrogenase [Salinisphaera hydrothermalis C41B8]|uniref:Soluble pyridine nucleotide transhydrogenase n=1 Tax=Salinisphaera hydrothermalis (strain C41B8) TaxID=1304275 RepID=A0A084IKC4_SALHC|nr:soluble pyridine nucleotide transhydrogenase [Salinisphaera hydrothermalis C41B8]
MGGDSARNVRQFLLYTGSSERFMAEKRYEVVVIGTGPSGESAALNAAKHGRSVAVIERVADVGGNCTHRGTIPSKALRQAVKQLLAVQSSQMLYDLRTPEAPLSWLLERWHRVVDQQVKMRSSFYGRNGVDVIGGHARFTDEHHISVTHGNGREELIAFDQAIIATGSRPYEPPDVDFSHPRIFNSDTILDPGFTPRSMIIYGAGVIGSEYASIFSGIGVKVQLINSRERLLEFLDDEISDALSYHLRLTHGVLIRHNEEYDRIAADDDGVTLHLKSGKKVRADALLWANGRTGNTDDMGLDQLGIEPNQRGQIAVDDRYRTRVRHIHAVGDVIGIPSLASAGYGQGRAASADAIGVPGFRYVDDVPTGIYTIPEISSLGPTERELTESCTPYEVGQALFQETARAQITGDTVGMLKLLFDPVTHQILGIHCFGDQASEIVHIGQAIMSQDGAGNTIDYFVNTTFNYPTMAEAYRTAALDGLNRIDGVFTEPAEQLADPTPADAVASVVDEPAEAEESAGNDD